MVQVYQSIENSIDAAINQRFEERLCSIDLGWFAYNLLVESWF